MAGEALLPGQIYNSNGPMLCAALAEKGLKAELFHIEDDLAKTQQVFQRAADDFDVLISVGGVSVGDADYVKQAIESLGSMEFWKVAMKPGKPLAFGRLGSKALLGLPGNPVSAFASYQLFAWPFLAKCQGEQVVPEPVQLLPIDLNAPMNPKRETFLRVSRVEENGALRLIPYPSQGSGILSSVVFSEGFARIPMGQKTQAGDRVNFIPFH
jgi:molybdopterin molybdotransferase